MQDFNREERIRKLLEQQQALRSQRPQALQADIDSQLLGNMGYNFAQIGQAFAPTTPEKKDYMPTSPLAPQLAEQERGIGSEIKGLQESALYDPTSPISKLASSAYAKEHGMEPDQIGDVSAKELASVPNLMKPVKQVAAPVEDRNKAALELAQRKADIDLKRQKELIDYRTSKIPAQLGAAKKSLDEKFIESQASKVPIAMKDYVELDNKFKNIDRVLSKYGTSLDTYNEGVDLPGVSLPGIGRVELGEGPAELRSAMQAVLNKEIKDLSGAAVSNQEMERINKAFAQGKYNTEPQMIQAMKDYREAVKDALANAKAGFMPEAVGRFQGRGGNIPSFNPQKAQKMYDTQTQLSKDQVREGLLQAAKWMKSEDANTKAKGQKLYQKLKAMGAK